MDVYQHELHAYKYEIEDMAKKFEAFKNSYSCADNLTHFSFALSNRSLLIVVGLCSLVESRLFELAESEQNQHQFKIDDLSGQGLTRLEKYLSKSKRIDFVGIKNWSRFKAVYKIRNIFVHSYGGLVGTKQMPKAKAALESLNMKGALFKQRIRLSSNHMFIIYEIFTSLFEELRKV